MPLPVRPLPIDAIIPAEGASAPERRDQIYDSMRRKGGWFGRGLLVIEDAGHYRAFTGCHRYAAAKMLDLHEIPCSVVDERRWRLSGLDYREMLTIADENRVEEFRRVGLDDAADVLEMEIAANKEQRAP